MEPSLKSAVVAVLRPLVRYLMRQGVTYPGLAHVLKEVYVKEAERLAQTDATAVTTSRITLLSGIHRKDVARLRAQPDLAVRPSRAASIAARVVAEWISRAGFTDSQGHPAVLPIKAPVGQPSFEALVRLVKADLKAATVLEELIRVGVAAPEEHGVRLLRTAYVSDFSHEKLPFLGANVGDHMAAATHNLSTRESPFIERAVYYDSIPKDQLGALRSELAALAEHLLRDANQRIMPLDDDRAMTPRSRVRLGVYYYEEDSEPRPEDQRDDVS